MALLVWLLSYAAAQAPAEVAALVAEGRTGRAAWTARRWLAADPTDPERWVLLAGLEEDAATRAALYREALRIAPDHVGAVVGLGRALASAGERAEAVAVLERARALAPDAREPRLALAEVREDPDLALAAWSAFPGDPDAALLVARLAPASADAALAGVDDPRAAVVRVERALGRGDLAAAQAELATLDGPEAERLGRWARCLREGTADPAAFTRFLEARRRAVVTPGAVEVVPPLPACAAAQAERAALAPAGAVEALRAALASGPDPGLAVRLGDALLAAGAATEARPLLAEAAAARPWDPEPRALLGRALLALGDRAGARAVLAEAAARFPEDAAVALAWADAQPDRGAALEVLLAFVSSSYDPVVLARARALAEDLDRLAEVVAAQQEAPRAPLGPLPDDVSEEIVVLAEKPSAARLRELVGRLREMGYGEPVARADGTLFFAATDVRHPWVELHPDGLVDVQRAGVVPVDTTVGALEGGNLVGVSGTIGVVSERKLWQHRARVLEEMRPALLAWREALCAEGFEERLVVEIPATLDAIWRDGVPRGGRGHLETPAERRAELLDWWATRACTPEGEQVRTLIARYLVHEVQTSAWPVTAQELVATNAARLCPGPLVLDP